MLLTQENLSKSKSLNDAARKTEISLSALQMRLSFLLLPPDSAANWIREADQVLLCFPLFPLFPQRKNLENLDIDALSSSGCKHNMGLVL